MILRYTFLDETVPYYRVDCHCSSTGNKCILVKRMPVVQSKNVTRSNKKIQKHIKPNNNVPNGYKILEYGFDDGMQYTCFMMHQHIPM